MLRAWQQRGTSLDITGIGGDQMQTAGLESLCAIDRLAVMGLVEPLKRLPELLGIRRRLIAQQQQRVPDLFVGVDSPDFNLPVERRLRAAGIPTAHLVSPSVWAWRRGRLRGIRESVDRMLCLLPFEVDIYREAGIDAVCVGRWWTNSSNYPQQAHSAPPWGYRPTKRYSQCYPAVARERCGI